MPCIHFLAQPIQPNLWPILQRPFSVEPKHGLAKIMVKSPCSRQHVMTKLDRPVIEPFDCSPLRVIAIVKKNFGVIGMSIAAEHDDAQCFAVDIVLQPCDLEVIVFNHAPDYHCLSFRMN